MPRTRRMGLPLAALLTCAGLLAGCSSGSEPETEASPSLAPQSDAQLGPVLSELLVHGQEPADPEGLAGCLITAVRDAGISPEAEKTLVESTSDDWAKAVSKLEAADAKALLGEEAMTAIDTCITTEFEIDTKAEKTVVEPVGITPKTGKANTKPKYKLDKKFEIRGQEELTPGLISMFTSFNPASKDIVKASASCMAETILAEDFESETLHFLAGGAPLSTGSVAEAIKDKDDAKTWSSVPFQAALSSCTTAAAQEKTAEGDT